MEELQTLEKWALNSKIKYEFKCLNFRSLAGGWLRHQPGLLDPAPNSARRGLKQGGTRKFFSGKTPALDFIRGSGYLLLTSIGRCQTGL